jgi:hypothetical protein
VEIFNIIKINYILILIIKYNFLNFFKKIFLKIKFKKIEYLTWGLGIGDWGLGIGDWGLGIGPNPQSPNPQSPIPNPQVKYFHIFSYNFLY